MSYFEAVCDKCGVHYMTGMVGMTLMGFHECPVKLREQAEEIMRHMKAGVQMNSTTIPIQATTVLSLLDRIEELEKSEILESPPQSSSALGCPLPAKSCES